MPSIPTLLPIRPPVFFSISMGHPLFAPASRRLVFSLGSQSSITCIFTYRDTRQVSSSRKLLALPAFPAIRANVLTAGRAFHDPNFTPPNPPIPSSTFCYIPPLEALFSATPRRPNRYIFEYTLFHFMFFPYFLHRPSLHFRLHPLIHILRDFPLAAHMSRLLVSSSFSLSANIERLRQSRFSTQFPLCHPFHPLSLQSLIEYHRNSTVSPFDTLFSLPLPSTPPFPLSCTELPSASPPQSLPSSGEHAAAP